MATENPIPSPSCGQTPCDDAKPFDAATGAAEQGFSFLQTKYGSFDISWYNLYESGNPNRGLGPNWSASQFAELIHHGGDDGISVMFAPGRSGGCGCGGANTYWFKSVIPQGEIGYPPCFGCLAQLTKPDDVDWRLVEQDGTVTIFDKDNGLIKSQTTPGGQVTEFTYTASGRIEEMSRTFSYGSKETVESRLFEYDSSTDDLQYVTLRRSTGSISWTEIRRLELVYYTTNENEKGNIGDLKLIKQQLPGPTAGSWVDDKIQLFRYYTSGEENGFQHGLKYVLSPEGYERIPNPEGSSNDDLAPFASAYYEYDSSSRRVKKVSIEGGQVTDTITFAVNPDITVPSDYTADNWLRKAVITMPDGLEKTVYSNHVGQDLLIDDKDGNDHWITYRKYNADYRLVQLVHPSAIDMESDPYYDPDEKDLDVKIKTDDGLIDIFTYNTHGYLELEGVQKGSATDNAIDARKTEYDSETIGSGDTATTVRPVSKITLYRSDGNGGEDGVVTEFEYTSWHSGTVQPDEVKTKLPNVPALENGIGFPQGDETTQKFDIQGRLISSTDARGVETTFEYDEVTGAQTKMIQDAGIGGLQLITDMTNDDLGRQTESLGPSHDINDQEALRTADWTVYQDADDEVWTGRGYKIDSSYTLVNPVSIQKQDKNGRTIDSIQATRGSGVEDSGKLSESDDFSSQSSWVRWTRKIIGDGGRVTAVRVYHTIPPSGEGSASTNYDETSYGYDSMGRQNKVKVPNGTITRTVYDVRGLVDSVWVGTNDTNATDTDPTGGGTFANNMKKVVQNQYDDGDDGGDGNLTKVTRPVDDTSSNDRDTEMEYDWRDRLTTTTVNDGGKNFYTIQTLDNQGRTTVSVVKGGSLSPVLIAKNETKFDTRGRIYRTLNYAVSDSGVAGTSLKSNTWFDENGNVIKSQPAGSQAFTKTTYDAINRPTNSYLGYYDGTGDDVPTTLVDNVIFTESESEYDAASNVIFTTSKQRFHSATGSGALNGPGGSQPKSRDSYVLMWYDGIGRTTESANYGTNAGTKPTRSNSAPSSSDTILVSESVYNADGELEDTIDPAGKKDRTEYDDAGRTTKVTMNFNGTETEVTRTDYAGGQMSKLIAENSTTGNQETVYTYGVTTTNSKIASNDLLRKVTYPDAGEVLYEYNRQNEQIKLTDQNETIHVYEYDDLGRRTKDRVTLAGGSAVDNSVLRIEITYDGRMRIEKVTSYDAATGGSKVNEVQFDYNDFNQVTKDYQAHGGTVNTSTSPKVQYAYESGSNNNIRPTSVTYPDGQRVVNYDYGAADEDDDQLSRILKLKIGTDEIVNYSYLGLNQVVIQKYTEPSTDVVYNLATGTFTDPYLGLDRFGRIVSVRWDQGTTKLVDYDYTYDRVGNRTTLDVKLTPMMTAVDELYVYDGLHRLTDYDRGSLVSGSISSPTLTQDWTLDQTGNWTNFIQGVVGALNQDRTHNKANEITDIDKTVGDAWPTPTHDDNGNMTAFPQPKILTSAYDATWDAWNQLVKLEDDDDTVAEYEYDGLGRRIIKKVYDDEGTLSETRHYYLSTSSQVLEERVDTETDPVQQFLWGIRFVDDLVLRDKDTAGNGLDERLYGLADPRFSILAIVDDTGAVHERYAYDGYGRCDVFDASFGTRTESSFAWEYRYTGRRLDLETGIYYFRARFYHAELGRFIIRDPIGYFDGYNLYRAHFVAGSVDPSGTAVCKCISTLIVAENLTWEVLSYNYSSGKCSDLNISNHTEAGPNEPPGLLTRRCTPVNQNPPPVAIKPLPPRHKKCGMWIKIEGGTWGTWILIRKTPVDGDPTGRNICVYERRKAVRWKRTCRSNIKEIYCELIHGIKGGGRRTEFFTSVDTDERRVFAVDCPDQLPTTHTFDPIDSD